MLLKTVTAKVYNNAEKNQGLVALLTLKGPVYTYD